MGIEGQNISLLGIDNNDCKYILLNYGEHVEIETALVPNPEKQR
jgi:hypothetical protein